MMRDPLNISVDWTEKMQFTATNDKTDAKVAIAVQSGAGATENNATGSKHLFLQGFAGCTGGAVLFLLEKMRAEMPTRFVVDVSGKLTTEHPMYFETIDVVYRIDGNTDVNAIKKAVTMSEDKYCGLTYMLRKASKVSFSVLVNGQAVEMS